MYIPKNDPKLKEALDKLDIDVLRLHDFVYQTVKIRIGEISISEDDAQFLNIKRNDIINTINTDIINIRKIIGYKDSPSEIILFGMEV